MINTPKIHNILIPEREIAQFCQRNHIRRLSLFGSVLRDDFTPESDVDLLVEFEAGCVPGFLGLTHMQRELSELFNRRVDLRTPASLSDYFRAEVEASAVLIYAA